MANLTSKLIVSLVDHVTAPSRAVSAALGKLTNAQAANNAKLREMRGRIFSAAGAGYVLYQGLRAPIKAAVEFESAMADVRKVVNFPTPKAFKEMGRQIRALSLQLPMTADGIARIVAAAGQSGIANQDLMAFAKMATKVAVAWDVSSDVAGDSLAKLKTALGLTIPQVGSLADAINYLSNKTAAGAPDLLDFTKRVAPMAKTFGLTAKQAAAFGSAMIGSGFQADIAATSFLHIGQALTAGASATKSQKEGLDALGLSSSKVAKRMQVDAVGTIQDVIARIRKLPKEMQAAEITNLFGKEARAVGPLITNVGLLGENLGYVAKQANYAGSAQSEYDVRVKTTANSMQLFQNQVTELARSIGDALIPALNRIMGVLGPVAGKIADLAQRFPKVTETIIALVAGVVAFRIAAIAARWAGLFLKGAIFNIGVVALKSARLMTGLLNPVKLVTGAFRALKLAVIGTGIGAIIVGIALAGTWIYKNWSGIAEMFRSFGRAFMVAIKPVRPVLDPVIDGIKMLVGWVKNLLGPIDQTGEGWRSAGQAAGEFAGKVVREVVELPGKIAAMASMFVQSGKDLMNGLFDGVKRIMGQIVGYIKSSISGAIGSVKSTVSGWANTLSFGLIGGDKTKKAVAGTRAAGGPVMKGLSYLVGERGPEIVTFARDAFVHGAAATARMSRAAALAGAASMPAALPAMASTVHVGGITIEVHAAPGQSPEAVADAVERVLSHRLGALSRGAFSDGAN